MFTSLANYLLGNQQPVEEPAGCTTETDVRLRAVDEEDDWVLVDNSIDSDDERRDTIFEESVFESLPSFELAVSTIPHSFHPTLRPAPAPADYYSLSRGSSSTSLPCLSLEESWFLTPPPCFTSEGPITMETSPLENLLIEHPSMSVYQHSSSASSHRPLPPVRSSRGRSDSTGGSSNGSTSSNDEVVQLLTASGSSRRVNGLPTQHQQEKQCVELRSAQKIRQQRANQVLKRNNMDRQNKAREINSSKNKRQRRADRQQHHSGANNNRKCCY